MSSSTAPAASGNSSRQHHSAECALAAWAAPAAPAAVSQQGQVHQQQFPALPAAQQPWQQPHMTPVAASSSGVTAEELAAMQLVGLLVTLSAAAQRALIAAGCLLQLTAVAGAGGLGAVFRAEQVGAAGWQQGGGGGSYGAADNHNVSSGGSSNNYTAAPQFAVKVCMHPPSDAAAADKAWRCEVDVLKLVSGIPGCLQLLAEG